MRIAFKAIGQVISLKIVDNSDFFWNYKRYVKKKEYFCTLLDGNLVCPMV